MRYERRCRSAGRHRETDGARSGERAAVTEARKGRSAEVGAVSSRDERYAAQGVQCGGLGQTVLTERRGCALAECGRMDQIVTESFGLLAAIPCLPTRGGSSDGRRPQCDGDTIDVILIGR